MAGYETRSGPPSPEPSGWALGGIAFAASILTLAGFFQAISGLVAIFDDDFYVVTRNYTFDLDVSAWGWIHLIIGSALLATGLGLFTRQPWAGVVAIMLAMLSALGQLLLHSLLPDLVAAGDRAGRVGDLGADATGRDQDLTYSSSPIANARPSHAHAEKAPEQRLARGGLVRFT